MRNTAIKVFAISACAGLAGCGGGGSGGQILPGDGSFDSLIIQTEQLTAKLQSLPATPVAMPTTGGATYNGVIAIADNLETSSEGVIGSTTLVANFSSETISGSSGNFYSLVEDTSGNLIGGGSPVPGNLTHFGSGFSGGAVNIETSGPVELEGVERIIDGELLAVFAGGGADMIAGFAFDMPAGLINVDAVLIAD